MAWAEPNCTVLAEFKERCKKGSQVREEPAVYNALFGAEKVDIGPQKANFWDINAE